MINNVTITKKYMSPSYPLMTQKRGLCTHLRYSYEPIELRTLNGLYRNKHVAVCLVCNKEFTYNISNNKFESFVK